MQLTSLDVLEERVNRGASLLDLLRPNWAREIDVDRFEIACPVHSVTGQLFGPEVSDQMDAVGIHRGDDGGLSACDAFAENGFCVLHLDVVEIPESIRARMRAIGEELSAMVGKDLSGIVNAPKVLPVPRDEDVVSQEAFTLELLWKKAVLSRFR